MPAKAMEAIKTDLQKLHEAVAFIDAEGSELPGDSAYSMGVGVLDRFGVSNAPLAPGQKLSAYRAVTRKLADITGPRNEASLRQIKRAFQAAIRRVEKGAQDPAEPAPKAQGTPARRGFKEQAFLEQFDSLIAEDKTEKALDLLIETLPSMAEAGMNRKEKLKHLTFAGRRLQHAGLGKYGIQKMAGKARIARRIADKYGLPSKRTFVDFGCGAHEPLGLATYFFANGFEQAVGNDFLPIRSSEYAAISMYDILSYMRNFPEEFLAFDQTPEDYAARLSRFDLKALMQGDFASGVQATDPAVRFLSCDIRESGLEAGSVSYLVSFAVFEHVQEMASVCAYLFDLSEPGGLQHHFIDLADHRAYRHDGVFNKFSFLTEAEAAPNLNRLRASEHIAAFEAAGFEILNAERQYEEIPEETFARFLPKWRDMAEDDQRATTLTVTLRKPA